MFCDLALQFVGRHWVMSLALTVSPIGAASWDPSADDYSGRHGATSYVSSRGDNSDGTSWQRAFRTIQAALRPYLMRRADIASSFGLVHTSRPTSRQHIRARPRHTICWSEMPTESSGQVPRAGW